MVGLAEGPQITATWQGGAGAAGTHRTQGAPLQAASQSWLLPSLGDRVGVHLGPHTCRLPEGDSLAPPPGALEPAPTCLGWGTLPVPARLRPPGAGGGTPLRTHSLPAPSFQIRQEPAWGLNPADAGESPTLRRVVVGGIPAASSSSRPPGRFLGPSQWPGYLPAPSQEQGLVGGSGLGRLHPRTATVGFPPHRPLAAGPALVRTLPPAHSEPSLHRPGHWPREEAVPWAQEDWGGVAPGVGGSADALLLWGLGLWPFTAPSCAASWALGFLCTGGQAGLGAGWGCECFSRLRPGSGGKPV